MPTVIKSPSLPQRSAALAFQLDDLAGQAQRYLDQVREHAAGIVAAAQQEAATIRQRAEADGREAAGRAAQQQADERLAKQLETLLPALRQTVAGLEAERSACRRSWEGRLIHVAAAIARRVVRGELVRQPQVPLIFIREAVELAAGAPQVRVLLHPDDYASLKPAVHKLLAEFGRAAAAEVAPDAAIARGGCRLETRHGAIDQQIDAQLSRIEEDLAA
jgi:flagellar assembly protein FliH